MCYRCRQGCNSEWLLPVAVTSSAHRVSTRAGVLSLVTADISGRMILQCQSCLVSCGMFGSIQGPLPTRCQQCRPTGVTMQNISTCCQIPPESQCCLIKFSCSREADGSIGLSNYPTNTAVCSTDSPLESFYF